MSEQAPARGYGARFRRAGFARFALAILVALLGALAAGQAANADDSPVPEDVAAYFATGLVPRLADLYGSHSATDPASTFDETTKVGTIHRLLAWTPAFLAGEKTDAPTELTNTWIAPVTAKDGAILGLAAVWINPGSGVVELADFSRGRALVDALGRAPAGTELVNDTVQQAWFATDGKTLTPLVIGKSGTNGPLSPAEFQKILRDKAVRTAAPAAAANPGLLIAGITLGAVVVLLAVFILLPGRKQRREAGDVSLTPRRNPRDAEEKAFNRTVVSTEARAASMARAAVSAEAGLVDAMAESASSSAATPAATPLRAVRPFFPDDEPAQKKAPAKRSPAPRTTTAPATSKKSTSPAASSQGATAKSATSKRTTTKAATIKGATPKSATLSATPKSVTPSATPKSATPSAASSASAKGATATSAVPAQGTQKAAGKASPRSTSKKVAPKTHPESPHQ